MIWIILGLFLMYNLHMICKFKTIPVSISDTVYMESPTLFSCFIGIESVLLLVPWLQHSEYQILPYLSIISLIVCSSAPLFKEPFHGPIHYISAIIGFLFILMWILIYAGWIWLLGMLGAILILSVLKPQCWVYWSELVVFISLVLLLI